MTPEEAENFYEEDEDPAEVFAWVRCWPARCHGAPVRSAAAAGTRSPGAGS